MTASRGSRNERAIKLYRRLARYRKSGVEVPMDIVLKARFSNCTIDSDELAQMQKCLDESIAVLRQRAWYHKLIDRLIFALY